MNIYFLPIRRSIFACVCLVMWSVSNLYAVLHNPALSGGDVLFLLSPANTSPVGVVNISWLSGSAPTSGTLTVEVQSGGDKIELLDDNDQVMSSPKSWTSNYPGSFKVRAKAVSSSENDVVININHDSGPVGSHTLTVARIRLKQVKFVAENSADDIGDLKSDTGQTYTSPQWLDQNLDGDVSDSSDHHHPMAFIRNKKPKITALFDLAPTGISKSFKVTATGPSGFSVASGTALTQNSSGDTLELNNYIPAAPIIDQVKYYSNEPIEWEVVPDGSSNGAKVATSRHRIYVVAAKPTTSIRRESLFHISCSAADGKTSNSDITSAIWTKFANRDVRRYADTSAMTYYGNYLSGNVTTESLLADGDGQCYAWVYLFLDLRKAHGISESGSNVVVCEASGADSGFLVKNWSFAGSGSNNAPGYPYINLAPQSGYLGLSSYIWLVSEVTDDSGVSGQGNANPASIFGNHIVALIGGDYYDASYGVVYSSFSDIEQSIAGYMSASLNAKNEVDFGVDLNGNGNATDQAVTVIVFDIRKANSGGLIANPDNY